MLNYKNIKYCQIISIKMELDLNVEQTVKIR